MMKKYVTTIKVRCYCEACESEYLTAVPERGCPVCKAQQENIKAKGGVKHE